MNLVIPSYRRPLLDHEGACLRPWRLLCLPVCHKGNASQAQSSAQTGAQTKGIVSQGSSGGSNTGTVAAGGDVTSGYQNSINQVGAGGVGGNVNTSVGAGTSINVNSDSTIQAALTALENSLGGSQQLLAQAGAQFAQSQAAAANTSAAASDALAYQQQLNQQQATAGQTTTSGQPAAGGFSLLQMPLWELAALLIGGIGLVLLVFRRKQHG